MAQADKAPRQNRTLTVDFHDEATYCQLLDDTKAFIECSSVAERYNGFTRAVSV